MSVVQGEITQVWGQAPESNSAIVPGAGCAFAADFGAVVFHFHLENDNVMAYTVARGRRAGTKKRVSYKKVEIRPDVHMLTWQESDKTTVTYVGDFRKQTVYASITTPDNESIHLKGSLRPVDTAACFRNGSVRPVNEPEYPSAGAAFSFNDRSHLVQYAKSFYDMSVQQHLDIVKIRLA